MKSSIRAPAAPVLEARGVDKIFPGVHALRGVDLALRPGQVHALVGENGAGKTTLIKILAGLLKPTGGELLMGGERVSFSGPLQSQAAGISVIAQEFQLVPQLSIVENIFLGREPQRPRGVIDWRRAKQEADALLNRLGIRVPVTRPVESLTIADQQLVEIAKALAWDFRVMIMDEPTASLHAAETTRLFSIVETISRSGVAVLYVSHRLREVFQLASVVTVLRDGQVVAHRPLAECSEDELVALMLGRPVDSRSHPLPAPVSRPRRGDVVLSVRDIRVPRAVHGVSFDVRRGEILGVAGLVGSGRTELMRAIFGLEDVYSGEITVDGRRVQIDGPQDALRAGISMLTEDRKAEGILPDLSVEENLVLSRPPGDALESIFIRRSEERLLYEEMQEVLSIRAYSPRQSVATLSGGNQQKVLVGRWLATRSRVFLLNEPTRGVDVGAKFELHRAIRSRLASTGAAVVVSSSDAAELVALCDRCLVLNTGRIVAELSRDQITEDGVVAAALREPRMSA